MPQPTPRRTLVKHKPAKGFGWLLRILGLGFRCLEFGVGDEGLGVSRFYRDEVFKGFAVGSFEAFRVCFGFLDELSWVSFRTPDILSAPPDYFFAGVVAEELKLGRT